MTSLLVFHVAHITAPLNNYKHTPQFCSVTRFTPRKLQLNTSGLTHSLHSPFGEIRVRLSTRNLEEEEEEEEGMVQELRVPQQWLDPSKAAEESEWLRVTLHKWLDDEYCPEPTNIDISKIAAQSYYKSLGEKETDLGEILLQMARDLESISYQESFHGAFSSANAAINLIIQKIEQVQ